MAGPHVGGRGDHGIGRAGGVGDGRGAGDCSGWLWLGRGGDRGPWLGAGEGSCGSGRWHSGVGWGGRAGEGEGSGWRAGGFVMRGVGGTNPKALIRRRMVRYKSIKRTILYTLYIYIYHLVNRGCCCIY